MVKRDHFRFENQTVHSDGVKKRRKLKSGEIQMTQVNIESACMENEE